MFATILSLLPSAAAAVPVTLEYLFAGPYSMFGYMPVPQVNGFDYAITNEVLDSRLAGQSFTLTSILLTADAVSLGSRVNFDVEIHLSGAAIGLPAGQHVQTHVDPVAGYTRIAQSQFLTVVGDRALTGPFALSVSYDAALDTASASPALATVKKLPVETLTIGDGLHAQLFFWTADNRNVDVDLRNVRLVVQGDAPQGIPTPVPEPSTVALLSSGLAAASFLATVRRRRRHWSARGGGSGPGG